MDTPRNLLITQGGTMMEQIERIKKSANINNGDYEIGHAINDIELLLDAVETLKADNTQLLAKLYSTIFVEGDQDTKAGVYQEAYKKWAKMEAENEDLKRKEVFLYDIHNSLGIKWGDNPYAVFNSFNGEIKALKSKVNITVKALNKIYEAETVNFISTTHSPTRWAAVHNLVRETSREALEQIRE